MGKAADRDNVIRELDELDRACISEVFHAEIVPRLMKRNARSGNLGCGFAGEKYRRWMLRFRSAGSGFEIVEFEYDREGDVLDLDL